MAINIKFDLNGNPEPPTIVLATRNGNKLGQLDVNPKSIDLSDKFNDASEFTFTLNKYINGKLTNLWDKVTDFKLIYCKEWDLWFEATVELDEKTETVKTVFCKQLGQAELSQVNLYNVEINTEKDIARDDYKITILYDPEDSKASLLDRLLEKAPHYNLIHVDSTIANIQRSFSFDDISICDALYKVAEEIGCLFLFGSNSDENGKPLRTIAVYDLEQNCNDCEHRGEFTDVCPKCGSKNIRYGYGEDTLIFVTSDELAADDIQFKTDTDSVKNCFKLEAGDDLMTATIRNCNPNGTDYIWYFSDSLKEDMPENLVSRIESYDEMYRWYQKEYVSSLDSTLLSRYNSLVSKYSVYDKELEQIVTPIKGYSSLMNAYYNVIDLSLYLKSGLMPSVEMKETDAKKQALLLTASSLSPVAVTNVSIASLATMNSAVLAMAKTIVKSTYKVQVNASEMVVSGSIKYWKGNFVITNYSDEEDTAVSNIISVRIDDDLETFIKQKIDKALNKEDTDDLSIAGLFKKEYTSFCAELKKYALNPLISFRDACQSCIDILIEQGVGNNNSWADTDNGSESNLYEKLYTPYYDKLSAIEAEIKIRENEINIISGTYDLDGKLVEDGLQTNIEECKTNIQEALDFRNYLGEDLWLEFCTYRREDRYQNDNYISDGLNNAELFEKALEFYKVAENEIFKSAELQHSISTTLNNLLAIKKFKPLVDSFKLGNWLRVEVDDQIYKLRLLEYDIDFNDFSNIKVEFSDVIKIKDGITDVEDILSQASSMASSYGSVQRQANKGNEARSTIREWLADGLNTALVQIQSNDNEDIVIDKNGLIGRSYNDITGTYSPEQIRLTHNIIAYTDDDWKTVRQAIGKHKYHIYDNGVNDFVDKIGYGISADFVTAGIVSGSQIIGGDVYSDNYSVTDMTGSYLNLRDGTFSFGGGALRFEGEKLIIGSNTADTNITEINEEWIKTTTVYAENLQVNAAKVSGELTAAKISADNITAGEIDANEVKIRNLTIDSLGSISFSDLSDHQEIMDMISSAGGGLSEGEATTLITQHLVSSPVIKGGSITSVGYLNNELGNPIESYVVKVENGQITFLDEENEVYGYIYGKYKFGDAKLDIKSYGNIEITTEYINNEYDDGSDISIGSGGYAYLNSEYGTVIWSNHNYSEDNPYSIEIGNDYHEDVFGDAIKNGIRMRGYILDVDTEDSVSVKTGYLNVQSNTMQFKCDDADITIDCNQDLIITMNYDGKETAKICIKNNGNIEIENEGTISITAGSTLGLYGETIDIVGDEVWINNKLM